MAKQQVRVELYYDNAWQNVTSDVYTRNPIQITRGRSDEQSEAVPCTATLTFDNRDGTYNPRNPSSSLYGKIGRNTPLRISNGTHPALEDNFNRSVTNGWTGGSFTWTLSGGTVPDDYDIDGAEGTHTHPSANVLHFSIADSGESNHRVRAEVLLVTTPTGASVSAWLVCRFTDTNNFYTAFLVQDTSDDVTLAIYKRVGGVFTQLTSPVQVFNSVGGSFPDLTAELYCEGNRIYARAWDTLQDSGTRNLEPAWISVVDDSLPTGNGVGLASRRETGNTNSNLVVQFPSFLAVPGTIRFTGEVASWTPRRAIKGDAWTDVTASGILRRLEQGAKPLRSALWREVLFNDPVAFWTLTEGESATSLASALPGGTPMNVSSADFAGTPLTPQWTLTSYGDWLEPLPTPPLEARLLYSGRFDMSTSVTEWAGDYVFVLSPDITASGGTAITFLGTGTVYSDSDPRVDWQLLIGGSSWQLTRFRWTFTNPTATNIGSGSLASNTGDILHARLTTVRDGADVDWNVLVNNSSVGSGTATSSDWETLTGVEAIVGATDAGSAAVGFIVVWDTASPPANAANAAVVGRSGELAGDRLSRLCDEEGIEFSLVGTSSDTEAMGPQLIDTLVANLQDCETVDMGILYEPRHQLGVEYRTRTDLYNQVAALTMDFDAAEVAPPLEPVIDDLSVRNDITVERPNGSSARSIKETGALSTQTPPDGVGLYDIALTINVDSDAQLAPIAEWRLSLGTVDEIRYPRATVDLDAVPALEPSASRLDIGDLVVIENPPDVPDDASLLVPGYVETIGSHRRTIVLNNLPATPYDVGVYNDSGTRYDSAYSTTAAQITTGTSTSLSVAIEAGRSLWVTGSGSPQFPFDIDLNGAQVTVTAISGASSPQTFTISSTVANGVNKVIPSGTSVRIWNEKRYGL